MKKVITLLTAILLFQLSGFTQFPLYVFPMTVIGNTYADTLINTKALIVREGIKKIYAYQTQPEATKTFVSKTMYFNENGNIEKITACFGKKENITFCINDTLLYDSKGRMTEMKMFDSKDSLYMRSIVDYISEKEIKYSTITIGLDSDTSIDFKYFNEKGQMVRFKQVSKGAQTAYTSFYYNKDGLLDSMQNENTTWGTFVFKRSERRKQKVIEMENPVVRYKWIYNLSGQCLTSEYTRKYLPNVVEASGYNGAIKVKVNYYYNPDGTLSKVTQERSDMPETTMYYSYSK